MTKYLIYCIFVLFLFANCKGIPKQPVKGAAQYCEDLVSFAVMNDYSHADELTRKYLDNYEEKDLTAFLIALKRQLGTSENHHLGVFISKAEGYKNPNLMELMRRIVAVSEAEKLDMQHTAPGTEKAALFCSILMDLAKSQNYDKAKLLMKRLVKDYVDVFYQDGSVYLNDNRYEECKEFCVSFKRNMTQEVWDFLNSKGMQSEEYTQFQMMLLAGMQAIEDEQN